MAEKWRDISLCCRVNVRIRDRVTVVVYPHQIKVGCTLLHKTSPPRTYSPVTLEFFFQQSRFSPPAVEFRHFRGFFLALAPAAFLPFAHGCKCTYAYGISIFSRKRKLNVGRRAATARDLSIRVILALSAAHPIDIEIEMGNGVRERRERGPGGDDW